jgi:hypothetical protein
MKKQYNVIKLVDDLSQSKFFQSSENPQKQQSESPIDKPTSVPVKTSIMPLDARTATSQLQEGISHDIKEQRKIGKVENRIIGNEENRKIGKVENRKIGDEEIILRELFDLSEEAYRKDSFFFTDDEFNAIVDLKITIARKEGIKITKTDLARIAFKLLMDNYLKEGEKSLIITCLHKRKSVKKIGK